MSNGRIEGEDIDRLPESVRKDAGEMAGSFGLQGAFQDLALLAAAKVGEPMDGSAGPFDYVSATYRAACWGDKRCAYWQARWRYATLVKRDAANYRGAKKQRYCAIAVDTLPISTVHHVTLDEAPAALWYQKGTQATNGMSPRLGVKADTRFPLPRVCLRNERRLMMFLDDMYCSGILISCLLVLTGRPIGSFLTKVSIQSSEG